MTFTEKNPKTTTSCFSVSFLFNELTFRVITLHSIVTLLNKIYTNLVKNYLEASFQPIVSSQGLFFLPLCSTCLGLDEFSVDMGADGCCRGFWVKVCLSGPKRGIINMKIWKTCINTHTHHIKGSPLAAMSRWSLILLSLSCSWWASWAFFHPMTHTLIWETQHMHYTISGYMNRDKQLLKIKPT